MFNNTVGTDPIAERIPDAMKGLLYGAITFDNGKAFAGHRRIAEWLGAEVYCVDPHNAWERGCNEHANGLLRPSLPKSTPLDQMACDQAKDIQNRLNYRPRKKLKFKTPNEVFLQQCCTSRLNSAAVADMLNIDKHQPFRIEAGEIATSIMTAYRLAEVLEVSMSVLFDFEVEAGE